MSKKNVMGPYLYVHYLNKDGTYKTLEFFEKSSIINEDLIEEISDEEKNTEKDDNTKPNENIKKIFLNINCRASFHKCRSKRKKCCMSTRSKSF